MSSESHEEIERWSPFRVWVYTLLRRNPKSNLAVIEHVAPGSGDRLLDIGCGAGAALEHALERGAAVAGIDPSPAMVQRAARRVPEAEVRVGSAEAIPFDDEEFSIVINISSYHHWADQEAGLREALRVLKPGGRLHIVEHKHNKKGGHGLSDEKSNQLVDYLLQLGYHSASVDTINVGRREYIVASAEAPA